MTGQIILISLLYILIWLVSMTVIQGLIDNSLSKYDMLGSIIVVSITITILVAMSRS